MNIVLCVARKSHAHQKKEVGRSEFIIFQTKKWAYDMWCLGYTQMQIAEALNVCEKTIQRALKNKPTIRTTLIYKGGEE